ncbi:outer membrane beta-barrel protein [Parafilimonas sp.]|uniref:outer membrane beta-barrel protein n=1 Tax=Parafilimonas sp. TaxID=1969739 RepID=UPI0039E62948
MKILISFISLLLLFQFNLYAQVNGKIISPSFSPVSSFVSYSFNSSSSSIVITNKSSYKLEAYNIYPNCCDASGPNKNGISNELATILPGESTEIPANYKGAKYFRSIVYKASDMELKTISGESQANYTQRYNENQRRGCELVKLQAQMGKEVCQAINGSASCYSDASGILETNNWCDNQGQTNSNSITNSNSTNNNITSIPYQNPQTNTSATNATQQKNEAILNAGNALIGAATDIYSTIQANKQKKEDYWNSLTPEEQQEIREANRKADSTKWANRQANDKEEANSITHHRFSIGLYGAIESRDFFAELSEFENQDGYGSTQPILSKIKQPTGYNVGLNFEWAVDAFGVGDKTRRGLFSVGLYYVTYSSPMIINQNYDPTVTFDGNVAMLKFQSIRVAPTLSVRLFRLGPARALSGVFFQWGVKADYMFSATAKQVSFDSDASTTGYNSISTAYNITDHFKKLEWGMICGLRLDLSRHLSFNVQYDVLGGLNDKILKAKYADNSDWYTFKQKNKITGGIGIYF